MNADAFAEALNVLPEAARQAALTALEAELAKDPSQAERLSDLAPWVNETLSGRASRDMKREVSDAIGNLLARQGRILLDTPTDDPRTWTPYVIGEGGEALPLDGDGLAFQALLAQAGLNPAEPVFRWIVGDLRTRAVNEGRRVRLARWVTLQNGALYVSCGRRRLVRVGPDELKAGQPSLLANGADGVLFAADSCLPQWNPLAKHIPPSELTALCLPLEAPPEVPDYTEAAQRRLLTAWLVARMTGTWPLPALTFIGAKGAGKSTAARAIAKLFLGEAGDVSDGRPTERDYKVAVTRLPVYVLDNLDAEPGDWFCDALAQTVTGGVITVRKLYTDDELLSAPIQAGVIITTRTALFAGQRGDILERLIPVFAGDLPDTERRDDAELMREVLEKRDGVLAWLSWNGARMALYPDRPTGLPTRFQAVGWYVHCLAKGNTAKRDAVLDAWRRAQMLSIVDLDPLAAAIMEYLPKDGLRGTPSEIVQALQEAGADLPYLGGGKAIARRLRELAPTLRFAGVRIREEKDEHRHVVLHVWRE